MVFHSSIELSYLWLPLIGFIIGLFASILGGGGGFIILPVLTLLFDIPAHIAVATSLAATLPICLVGSIGHYRNGNMDIRIGWVFALTGILGAVAGAGLTSLITPDQLKISYGIYSIVIALFLLLKDFAKKRVQIDNTVKTITSGGKKAWLGSFFGFMSGLITGTYGTSGAAPVMAGMFSMGMPVKMVVGTSIMVVLTNTVSAMAAHFLVGEIDLTLVYFLTAGAITGALIGPKILAGTNTERSEGSIRLWYSMGMIALGIIMIIK